MRYVQFFHRSTGWNGRDFSGPRKLIPACGSDGVLPLDGRLGTAAQHRAAQAQADRLRNVRPDLEAFQIWAGESFTRSRAIGGIVMLERRP